MATNLNPQKCFELIEEHNEDPYFMILEVRGPAEHAEGHVKGCVLIEFQSPDFQKNLEELDRDKSYLVYCRSGVRSAKAAKVMEEMGFKNICTMDKGFTNWVACGLPLE